jgi:hypothetical protein
VLEDEPGDAGADGDGGRNDAGGNYRGGHDGGGHDGRAHAPGGPARGAAAVPEVFEAGFLPRDGFRPAVAALAAGPRGGFGSGGGLDTALPGVALAAFTEEVTGPDGRCAGTSDDELIGVLRAWDRLASWAAGRKLAVIAELIRRRPGPGCGPADPAAMPAGWGKFCGDELAAATGTSGQAADKTLTLAHDLAARLPGTARALCEGIIDLYKARIIAEATRVLDPDGAAAAEMLVLAGVAGKTPGQLRAAAARAVAQVDPAAARARREKAERDTRVELWREDAGTAALCGRDLPPAEALAADQAITAYAKGLKAAGLDGTMDQLRARAFLDLTLGIRSHPAGPPSPSHPRATPETGVPPGHANPVHGSTDEASTGGTGGTGGGQGDLRSGGGEPGEPGTGAPGPGRPAPADPDTSAADPRTGLAARINLTIPLTTLLGLAERPGEAAGLGPIDPALARTLARSAARNPRTTWCVTVTDNDGHPTAHGCARPATGMRHRGKQPGGRQPQARQPQARQPQRQPPSGEQPQTGQPAAGQPAGRQPGRRQAARERPRAGDSRPAANSPGNQANQGEPAFAREHGSGLPGGHGRWRLRLPGGRDLLADIGPLPVTSCDHRHQSAGYQPSDTLRHLVDIRDGECTWPPCRRAAGRCDFEHAIPWDQGGRTCACNAGPCCRRHHHAKQAHGWRLEQRQPGYHTWTTPAGRTYTTGPIQYAV